MIRTLKHGSEGLATSYKQQGERHTCKTHLHHSFSHIIPNLNIGTCQNVTSLFAEPWLAFGLAVLNVLFHRRYIQISRPARGNSHCILGNCHWRVAVPACRRFAVYYVWPMTKVRFRFSLHQARGSRGAKKHSTHILTQPAASCHLPTSPPPSIAPRHSHRRPCRQTRPVHSPHRLRLVHPNCQYVYP